MKKLLLALAMLSLTIVESVEAFGRYASYTAGECCAPQIVEQGCRRRCCRARIIGRPRWTCCKTLRCCRPKKVCCPRYRCCRPRRACCPQPVPVCEAPSCVTTSNGSSYGEPMDYGYASPESQGLIPASAISETAVA